MRGFQFAHIGRHGFPKSPASHELQRWFTFDDAAQRRGYAPAVTFATLRR